MAHDHKLPQPTAGKSTQTQHDVGASQVASTSSHWSPGEVPSSHVARPLPPPVALPPDPSLPPEELPPDELPPDEESPPSPMLPPLGLPPLPASFVFSSPPPQATTRAAPKSVTPIQEQFLPSDIRRRVPRLSGAGHNRRQPLWNRFLQAKRP